MSTALPVLLLTAAALCSCRANAIASDVTTVATGNGNGNATGNATGNGNATATEPPPPPTVVVYNSSAADGDDENRDSRFLSFSLGAADQSAAATNTLQEKQQQVDDAAADPSAHLVDIYTDCLMQLSFPCVQRKLLLFLDKLGRMKGFSVLGDLLSVVRIKRDMRPPLNETELMARLNVVDEQSALSALMEHTLDRFINSHVVRIALPEGITAALKGKARSMSGNTLDINLSRAIGEGRGKKKYKKLMHMMMMGMMGKMALMGPLMMLMIKVKAIKALLLSKLALLMSLAQLMKGKKGGGSSGKEVIIVHDNHASGAEYGAGTAAGWVSGHTATGWTTGGGADSYSAGTHIGAADTAYAGAQDSYSSGAGAPTGWAGVNGHGGSGWARKSMVHEPHWVAYRAYIPTPEDDHANEK